MTTLIEKLKEVVALLQTIPNCRPVSVGGSVRDAIIYAGTSYMTKGTMVHALEQTGKDFDLEVFGTTSAAVFGALQKAGTRLELVGRAFPVYKVAGADIDISFPRRESKTGEGHTDFSIVVDPDFTFEEAALRRDFTCNAIGYDWNTDTILDPYLGRSDIKLGLLRPVSIKFKEDALRILRTFKFIARLGFSPTSCTVDYCKEMVESLSKYPRERVLPEWDDFILKGHHRYVFSAMDFLVKSGAIELYPELLAIIGVKQHPEHHPEGEVWNHTMHCLEYFMREVRPTLMNDEECLIIGYAVLTHDLGKAHTTNTLHGKITAYGHEDSPYPRKFLERLFDPANNWINEIEQLVKAHMRPVNLHNLKAGLPAIRRLNMAVNGRLDRLMSVVECDQGGRPPKPVKTDAIEWVLEQTKELKLAANQPIKPIVLGRHILTHLNLKPGMHYRPILDAMFEAQIEGKFNDETAGIDYLISHYRA